MNNPRVDAMSPEQRAEPVVIVAYDPDWPRAFEAFGARIAAALGDLAIGIEHVGSTAVPGLPAKPIIDVDVVMRRAEDFEEISLRLAALGYEHLGDLGIVGREAFRPPAGPPRHHLYVCAAGAPVLQAHLTFRDALRSDPGVAASYAKLKHELAERFRDDRDSYAEAKTAFISTVLMRQRGGDQRSNRR